MEKITVPVPFVGNTSEVRALDACRKDYTFLTKTQRYYHAQNPMIAPTARRYVQALLKEDPRLVSNVADKLAVVTGVFYDSVGYHVALELACLGCHVVVMARKQSNLSDSIEAIEEEAARRGVNSPILYQQSCDNSSLQSVRAAADAISKIADSKYLGKLSLLVHASSTGTAECKLTKDQIEHNTACNFVAPHYLTKQLLRLLQAASNPKYKARVLFSSSIGHCLGVKFNPLRLEDFPQGGGSPSGYILYDKDSGTIRESHPTPAAPPGLTQYWKQLTKQQAPEDTVDLAVVGTQVARSKYAAIADVSHLAKAFPEVCFVSYHAGSIRTDGVNMVGNMFRFTAAQGARAPLRAALDPEFNTVPSLQGAYLHCDGNPWHPELPKTKDPDTGEPFEWDAYCQCCYDAVEGLLTSISANFETIAVAESSSIEVSESEEDSSDGEEDGEDEAAVDGKVDGDEAGDKEGEKLAQDSRLEPSSDNRNMPEQEEDTTANGDEQTGENNEQTAADDIESIPPEGESTTENTGK